MKSLSNALFGVLATTGGVPIIRALPGGPAQMVSEHLCKVCRCLCTCKLAQRQTIEIELSRQVFLERGLLTCLHSLSPPPRQAPRRTSHPRSWACELIRVNSRHVFLVNMALSRWSRQLCLFLHSLFEAVEDCSVNLDNIWQILQVLHSCASILNPKSYPQFVYHLVSPRGGALPCLLQIDRFIRPTHTLRMFPELVYRSVVSHSRSVLRCC